MPKGRQQGSEGVEGVSMTPEDDELAKRRFETYIKIAKKHIPFEVTLKKLPLDGGSKLECGDTRFEHLQLEKCTGVRRAERCGREMRYSPYGGACVLKLGHRGSCKSNIAKEKQYAATNLRKRKSRQASR